MQRGSLRKHHGAWFLFYRENVIENGVVVSKKRSKRLAPVEACRTKADAERLAKPTVLLINSDRAPESTDSFSHFLETIYLPTVEKEQKPSTAKSYVSYYRLLKPHIGSKTMAAMTTADMSAILKAVIAEKVRARTSIKGVRNFMSGAFRWAKNNGHFHGVNPVTDVILPKGGSKPKPTYAYSLPELMRMLEVLPEPARTAVMVAGLTGLRHGEIRGLKWADFNGTELAVARSVWGSHVGEVKTASSAAPVPVVEMLAEALKAHHERNPEGEWIFTGERATSRDTVGPANLANMASRVIVPTLKAAGLRWEGWHSFRRGLGSNLNAMGVDDSVIQKILRHSDVSLTQKFYIKTTGEDSKAAMAKLEDKLKRC